MKKILEQYHYLILLLILGFITFLAYVPVLRAGFVWDDEEFILGWKLIKTTESLPQLLTGALPSGHEGVYRPIRSLAQMISYQQYGETPLWYHLQAVIFHILTTWIVFGILLAITRKKIISFTGALLFGIHPVQSEAVAFVSASFDTIGAIFYFASILFFLLSREFDRTYFNKKIHDPILQFLMKNQRFFNLLTFSLSIVFAYLAFFTTELTLSLPLVIGLLIHYQSSASRNKLIKITSIYVFGGVIFLILRNYFVSGSSRFVIDNGWIMFLTMTKALYTYVARIVFPLHLSGITTLHPGISNVFVDPVRVSLQYLWDLKTIAGIIIVAIFVSLAIFSQKKSLNIYLSIWLFFLALVPVSNIIPSGTLFAERYLYIAMLGVSLFWGTCIDLLWSVHLKKNELAKGIGITIFMVICIALISRTYIRVKDYQSPVSYWIATAVSEPNNPHVLNNLGLAFATIGRLQDGLKAFTYAATLDPLFMKAWYNQSRVLTELGQIEPAQNPAEKAFNLAPTIKEYATHYAAVLRRLGKIQQAQDVLASTSATFQTDPELWYALASTSIAGADYETAEDALLQSIRFDPTHTQSYITLGSIYSRSGTPSATIQLFTQGKANLKEKTVAADYYFTLASAYIKLNDMTHAKEAITQAFYLNPDDSSISNLWKKIVVASESSDIK